MSKRIKTTILFFILLIISVIGNTLYTSSNLSESFFIHSEHTSDCQLQAPLPMAEKALRHLSDHSQTDLPAAAVLTHVEKKQDTKSALYAGTVPVRNSHNGFTDLEITIQTGCPPLPKRIEYYIYTLERIQI